MIVSIHHMVWMDYTVLVFFHWYFKLVTHGNQRMIIVFYNIKDTQRTDFI